MCKKNESGANVQTPASFWIHNSSFRQAGRQRSATDRNSTAAGAALLSPHFLQTKRLILVTGLRDVLLHVRACSSEYRPL
jgi:hypothetical protein